LISWLRRLQRALDATRTLDFVALLGIRLYLAPLFLMTGMTKLAGLAPHPDTVAWFGNPDWGLGLPLPWVMVLLAAYTEVLGAISLLAGLAVRWMAIPLTFTMGVAALTVHLQHGWQVIADPKLCLFDCASAQAAAVRLEKARVLLKEHGNYAWLTEEGSFVVLNNGVELVATYALMLLVLFFFGAGRWVSADHWIARRLRSP